MADSAVDIEIRAKGSDKAASDVGKVGKAIKAQGDAAKEAAKEIGKAADEVERIGSDATLAKLDRAKKKLDEVRKSIPGRGDSRGIRKGDRGIDAPDVAFPGTTSLAGSFGALGVAGAAGGALLGIGKLALDEADQVQEAFGRISDSFGKVKDAMFEGGGEMIDFVLGDLADALADVAISVGKFLAPKPFEDAERHAKLLAEHTKDIERAAVEAAAAQARVTAELRAQAEQARILSQIQRDAAAGYSEAFRVTREENAVDRDLKLAILRNRTDLSPAQRAEEENRIADDFAQRQLDLERRERENRLIQARKAVDEADTPEAKRKAADALASEEARQGAVEFSVYENLERKRAQVRDIETAGRISSINRDQDGRAKADAERAEKARQEGEEYLANLPPPEPTPDALLSAGAGLVGGAYDRGAGAQVAEISALLKGIREGGGTDQALSALLDELREFAQDVSGRRLTGDIEKVQREIRELREQIKNQRPAR